MPTLYKLGYGAHESRSSDSHEDYLCGKQVHPELHLLSCNRHQ